MNLKTDESMELKGYYCKKPFTSLEFHNNDNVYFCCTQWTKTLGNPLEVGFDRIWNSEMAQDIRESIIDGSYKFCNKTLCPFIQSKSLFKIDELDDELKEIITQKQTFLPTGPSEIMLCHDRSCNLSCPSCRTKNISYTPGSQAYLKVSHYTQKIFEFFIKGSEDLPLKLNLTGSGDPFGSVSFREFLENLDGSSFPNLKIDFQTNGVLLTPLLWEKLQKIHKNINFIEVSVDAASEETYNKVRRGGNWKVLLENLSFLSDLTRQKLIGDFQVNMVVQKENYKEMKAFVKMFLPLNCRTIHFSLITNWKTWSPEDFKKQAIWHDDHPEHLEFLKILSDDIFLNEKVFIGNVSPYLMKARSMAGTGETTKGD